MLKLACLYSFRDKNTFEAFMFLRTFVRLLFDTSFVSLQGARCYISNGTRRGRAMISVESRLDRLVFHEDYLRGECG